MAKHQLKFDTFSKFAESLGMPRITQKKQIMEENDFVSIWLEESGNPAIEELTNKNLEVAHQTSNLLAEKNLLANDFARIVDINPDEISRWLMGKHSFSIKKLKEITEAFNTHFSAN